MGDFFKVVAAGPMFFVSAWVLMIFAGIVYERCRHSTIWLRDGDDRHHRALADTCPSDRSNFPSLQVQGEELVARSTVRGGRPPTQRCRPTGRARNDFFRGPRYDVGARAPALEVHCDGR